MTTHAESSFKAIHLEAQQTYQAYMRATPGVTFEAVLNSVLRSVEADPHEAESEMWQIIGKHALLSADGPGYWEEVPSSQRVSADVKYYIGPDYRANERFHERYATRYRFDNSSPTPHVMERPMMVSMTDTTLTRRYVEYIAGGGQVALSSLVGFEAVFEPPEDEAGIL